jgi:hypothetical protein
VASHDHDPSTRIRGKPDLSTKRSGNCRRTIALSRSPARPGENVRPRPRGTIPITASSAATVHPRSQIPSRGSIVAYRPRRASRWSVPGPGRGQEMSANDWSWQAGRDWLRASQPEVSVERDVRWLPGGLTWRRCSDRQSPDFRSHRLASATRRGNGRPRVSPRVDPHSRSSALQFAEVGDECAREADSIATE